MFLWYLFNVVVLMYCSFFWVNMGLSKFFVFMDLEFLWLLVFIMVWILLMNKMICLLELVIFFIIDCSFFLNFFWYLVLVIKLFIFREINCWFFNDFGMLLLIICWVKFLAIVVLFIFGLLIRIGLFLECWESIWIIWWIFLFWLIIGFSLFWWVCFVRFCLYLFNVLYFFFWFGFVIFWEFWIVLMVNFKFWGLRLNVWRVLCFIWLFFVNFISKCLMEMNLFF